MRERGGKVGWRKERSREVGIDRAQMEAEKVNKVEMESDGAKMEVEKGKDRGEVESGGTERSMSYSPTPMRRQRRPSQ